MNVVQERKKLATTIDELQQLEIEEFGEIGKGINWNRWHQLVAYTKEKIDKIRSKEERRKHPDISLDLPKFVYRLPDMEFLGYFNNTIEASKYFHVPTIVIQRAIYDDRPVYKEGLLFTNAALSGEALNQVAKRENRGTPLTVYVYRIPEEKLIGVYQSFAEAARRLQFPLSTITTCMQKHNGVYAKGNMKFTTTPIHTMNNN